MLFNGFLILCSRLLFIQRTFFIHVHLVRLIVLIQFKIFRNGQIILTFIQSFQSLSAAL